MGWWKNWKARNWDEKEIPGWTTPYVSFAGSTRTPRFRKIVRRFIKDCEENPLKAAGVIGSVIIGVLGLVFAIIQSLR